MDSKNPDDVQQLIDDRVYQITTTEVCPIEEELNTEILSSRSFESRGIINVIASTIIVTTLMLSFLYVHIRYTSSYFTELRAPTDSAKIENSTWETSYDLPAGVKLFEIYSSSFDFDSACPPNNFALVLNLETPITTAVPWMSRCGAQVLYFRMNGNPEVEDVDRIIKYVPNAQYIPIQARFHATKAPYNILSDPEFQAKAQFECNIITSLRLSGYLTSSMVKASVEIAPFVEELEIDGSDLCTSLVRQPKVSQQACGIKWAELKKLKIRVGSDCTRTYEFIDMCWDMRKLKNLEITESPINDVNVKYIEDIIDKYRITRVRFENNVCSDGTLMTHGYICGN